MIVRIANDADANLESVGDRIAKDNVDRAVTFTVPRIMLQFCFQSSFIERRCRATSCRQ